MPEFLGRTLERLFVWIVASLLVGVSVGLLTGALP